MRINFFEEFPNEETFKKLKLIDFPCLIYVASNSMWEFYSIQERIATLNPIIEVAYWPILRKSYWISPFSYNFELKELYEDLSSNNRSQPLRILLDLELPFLTPKLFFCNLFSFFRNKKLIKKVFIDSTKMNIEIYTAEYLVPNKMFQKNLEYIGVSYSINKYSHKKIFMFYSSMLKNRFLLFFLKKYIKKSSLEWNNEFQIALGTIATGVLGNEPILNPEDLERDLSFCRENKIDTVVIFRLGGLNGSYLKKIKKYL